MEYLMFAVIFKAKINELDEKYSPLAEELRELAIREYGCLEFNSCTQGNSEIAISYWESEAQIRNWKINTQHLEAQKLGAFKYYDSYTVQIAEIKREYGSGS
jgi:heme-degrading monooxygenase HmoA